MTRNFTIQNADESTAGRVRQSWRPRLWALLSGAAWGAVVVRATPLNPLRVDWLRVGDLSSAYMNLMYFRQSDWTQWPVTALPSYGTGWSTMFNEAGVVPLGILVKVFDWLLPAHFQYFGLWFLLCFALQGLLAYELFRRLVVGSICVWLGVFLLVTAPILSFRVLNLGHHDLAAHWLILLAMVVYLEQRLQPFRLGMFLLLALSVNAYLFVLSAVVVTAHLVALGTSRLSRVPLARLARAIPIVCLPSAVGYAAFGYLSWGQGVVGVGNFSLDAAAFLAPGFGGEAFAFLGFGAVVSCFAALTLFREADRSLVRQLAPLATGAVLLYLVAVSNNVTIGPWSFSYPLPELAETLRQVVRVSTRLSWLLYYFVIVVGVIGIDRLTRERRATGLGVLSFVVLTQLISTLPRVVGDESGVLRKSAGGTVIQDARWNTWAKSVDGVMVYPVFDVQADRDPETAKALILAQTLDWFSIIWWAAENNLPINFAYRSRPVADTVERENQRLQAEFTSGRLNERAIYITASRDVWRPVVPQIPLSMDTVFVDGLYVIYPKDQPQR